MTENKTMPTGVPVEEFLASVEHPGRRTDGYELLALMREATGQEPVMWGPSIVGFGRYHYRYGSGREGDSAAVGFSPRKASTTMSAVMPNEITMAVSTSACGSGSA